MANNVKYLSYEGLSHFKNKLDNTYAPKSHTHSYLPLTGGTMTGIINSQSIIPTATNTYDLGSSSLRWNNIYGKTIYENGTSLADKYLGKTAAAIKTGDGTIMLYAEQNNEINFGGTANSDTIYFGYRAKDSKAIPSKFVFGSSYGSAELLAKTYKKTDGTEVAYVSNSFITNRASVDNLTSDQITAYADLSTSSAGQTAFKVLNSGSYVVHRSGSSELLINLSSNAQYSSTSALEFLSNYTHTSRLKVRKIIDSNRVSGEFKELAWYSDIPTSLKNPNALTIQGNGTTLTNGVYDGSAAKTVNITAESLGLSKVFDYKGVTTTTLTDGSTTKPIVISNVSYTQKVGDVVIVNDDTDKEYFWNGSKWEEMGRTIDLSGYSPTSHTHSNATTTTAGFMSSADKSKLDGIEAGANKYTHPTKHAASMITGLSAVATSGSYNDLSNKPTSLKNPYSLTIVGNNTQIASYDGSSTVTATITAASIGAAASSHNHSTDNIISGTLSVSRGGTGLSTITTGHVIIGNGTGTPTTSKIVSITNAEIDTIFTK